MTSKFVNLHDINKQRILENFFYRKNSFQIPCSVYFQCSIHNK
jgi:hypothetical protein